MQNVRFIIFLFLVLFSSVSKSQHSVARKWNEVLLEGIRNDFARPTVHARNLFHTSIAMYDAWAVLSENSETYLLGKTVHNFTLGFEGFNYEGDVKKGREEIMSYALARLLRYRFRNSPGSIETISKCDSLLRSLGYDPNNLSINYTNGSLSGLGNYIGQGLIDYGSNDYSNEEENYRNEYYVPSNFPMDPNDPGNPFITDPNKWQPLTFDIFIDQAGNPIPGDVPPFLSPEWGKVLPFALQNDDVKIFEKFGTDFYVYHDPGPPPYLPIERSNTDFTNYQWGFSLVALWSSHLDPNDSVLWDISPASRGNIPLENLPTTTEGLKSFYNRYEGGDIGNGHSINPYTGSPYDPQWVLRGDYTRVLAEFWADGPDSETPPGHWFTILNYVIDHPLFERKFEGQGQELSALEWDVKSYLTLAGAMHDAAIASWGIKGYYDYVRPISAIRWMGVRGQSSDPNLLNYDPDGLPLEAGKIEIVQEGDPLAGVQGQHIGKIKLKAWKGPEFIIDPDTSKAGVGWILAENWWPYQRPSFVTPNFAGYISGHSTFSRAAAEVLTLLTGDPFFPGGIGEFVAKKNEFLVFEEGPSQDIILQWATYRDASDQTSLSRIWGGIHPPADDIPGRLIGEKIGVEAFTKAKKLFQGLYSPGLEPPQSFIYPNPISANEELNIQLETLQEQSEFKVIGVDGKIYFSDSVFSENGIISFSLDLSQLSPGFYIVVVYEDDSIKMNKLMIE
ncbi:MAG: T9SS type A sorting domain-containing protein [Bacteroidia bacterium]|nr:T9SS type A sorting domain-containing protein [Bacteroidia bacterium]